MPRKGATAIGMMMKKTEKPVQGNAQGKELVAPSMSFPRQQPVLNQEFLRLRLCC